MNLIDFKKKIKLVKCPIEYTSLVWPPVHNKPPFSGNCPQNTGAVAYKQLAKQYYSAPLTLTDWSTGEDPNWASCEESCAEILQLFYSRGQDMNSTSEGRSSLITVFPESWIL